MTGDRTRFGRRAARVAVTSLALLVALAALLSLPPRSGLAVAAEGADTGHDSAHDAAHDADRDRGRRGRERNWDADSDNDRKVERMGRDREANGDRRDIERSIEPDEVLALDLDARSLAAARSMGFRVIDDEPLGHLGFRVTRLATPGGQPPPVALRRLRAADPAGTYDVNALYGVAGDSPCEGIRCDGQKMVEWPAGGCFDPVRLGMIDTAVAASSPALAGTEIVQWHVGNEAAGATDSDHGTLVATILAGRAQAGFAGLLPRASLYAADVFGQGRGPARSTDAQKIAVGLDWLLGQEPDAINVSLSGPDNAVLHESIRRATARGIPVVAAAGNLGPDGPLQYPAAYPEAIAVTAVDHRGRPYARASRGDYIDIAAPGVHIWSAGADGRGRFVDGTSFAAPFVSAEAALLRRSRPGLMPPELKAELRRNALAAATRGAAPAAARTSLLKSRACVQASM